MVPIMHTTHTHSHAERASERERERGRDRQTDRFLKLNMIQIYLRLLYLDKNVKILSIYQTKIMITDKPTDLERISSNDGLSIISRHVDY